MKKDGGPAFPGYVFKTSGVLYLVRCPKCEKENYALAVADGQCAWCGYVATEEDVNA